MQLNNLKRQHKNKKARQIGRAGQRGKTSGRGTKGQNARAGHKKRPEIRDFIKRLPKMRGRGVNINTSIKSKFSVINLSILENKFKTGDIINPEVLVSAGIIDKRQGKNPKIKILGTGAVTKKFSIKGCEISASAKSAIEKAGGSIME